MEDIYRHIGRRVREERTNRAWTQEALAERLDVHPSFVGQIERGLKKPSLRTVKRIAVVFEITAAELLEEATPAQRKYPIERKFADLVRDQSPSRQKFLYETLRELVRRSKKLSNG